MVKAVREVVTRQTLRNIKTWYHNLRAEVQRRASHQSRRSPISLRTAAGLQPFSRMNRRAQQEMGQRSFPLIAVCWLVLLAIMGLRIYLTSELSENNTKQTAEIQNLKSRIQELETQKITLTRQIEDMETNWNKLNLSRAQWSINAYCLGNKEKTCQPCQEHWLLSESSCYEYHNPSFSKWKTWDAAQSDCRGQSSDLAVAHTAAEKKSTKPSHQARHCPYSFSRTAAGPLFRMKGNTMKDMEEISEEADYVNASKYTVDRRPTRPEDTNKDAAQEGTVDKKAPPPGSLTEGQRSFLLIAVCWLILLTIMGLRIYFTSELSEDNASLTAEILNLTTQIQELEAEKNLTVQCGSLTRACIVIQIKVKNLYAEISKLTILKDDLTKEIQDMKTNQNELNISQAQWTINEYCKPEGDILYLSKVNNAEAATNATVDEKFSFREAAREGFVDEKFSFRVNNTEPAREGFVNEKFSFRGQCRPCQKGWVFVKYSCQLVPSPWRSSEWKTWEEAREDCRGHSSDLAVEQKSVGEFYRRRPMKSQYWIGLRVVKGRWQWVDGSILTDRSWRSAPLDGQCVMSDLGGGWISVKCDQKHQWICQKKALSV
ncbi:uncharacterized protein LOC134862260 isoform X2 [Eleginops maclovinus]|uniref:uncharacterized protein LOC134862260 isoform X2 n=1 Tax=Eleginops maclovinus TaxID=56733 RepID=UPI0030801EB0